MQNCKSEPVTYIFSKIFPFVVRWQIFSFVVRWRRQYTFASSFDSMSTSGALYIRNIRTKQTAWSFLLFELSIMRDEGKKHKCLKISSFSPTCFISLIIMCRCKWNQVYFWSVSSFYLEWWVPRFQIAIFCKTHHHSYTRWSTCVLVFCCWPLEHVIYLKPRKKLILAKLSKCTKWQKSLKITTKDHCVWQQLSFCTYFQHSKQLHISELEINHVIHEPTANCLHKCRAP